MRTVGSSLSLALLALAACGNDSASPDAPPLVIIDAPAPDSPPPPPPDAPNYDFSCAGNQAPTTAADPITIAGTATEFFLQGLQPSNRPGAEVTVRACRGDCTGQNNLGTTTTAANGTFTTNPLGTDGLPLDGYIIASKTGLQNTRVYAGAPLVANLTNAPVFMVNSQLYGSIGLVVTHTTGRAIVAVAVTDCAGTPIPEATVTVRRGSTDLGVQTSGAMLGQPGAYLFTDVVPDASEGPDATVVSASYMGMNFLTRTVRAEPNVITSIPLRPGY